jgi:uncharacterized protein YndB with AHSA1/START domain
MKIVRWAGAAVALLLLLIGSVYVIGALLPQDHVAARTVTLNRPALDVWTVLTDVESFPAWRSSVSSVEILSRQPFRWREVGSDGTLTFEIAESQPPRRLVSEIVDKDLPFGGRWVYELEATDAGTALTITEQGEVYNPIFRFVSRFVFGHTATMDAYIEDLRKRLASSKP